jgi:hypothetical protein
MHMLEDEMKSCTNRGQNACMLKDEMTSCTKGPHGFIQGY